MKTPQNHSSHGAESVPCHRLDALLSQALDIKKLILGEVDFLHRSKRFKGTEMQVIASQGL